VLSETKTDRPPRRRSLYYAPDDKMLGLRERHKIAKHQRICDAAIALMGRDGYDNTTLRDIAREADVALGTLSLYARDKRDLTLMIFNKLIPPLFEEGRKKISPTANLDDNVSNFFEPCYHEYTSNVTLYRVILGQIYNGPGSVHAEENDAIRIEVLGNIADIIKLAIANGKCRPDVDIHVQTRSFFYLYFTAVRVWLFQDEPEPAQGLSSLKTIYAQHVRGLLVGA
jgi:AcrR family transcriptional regulator